MKRSRQRIKKYRGLVQYGRVGGAVAAVMILVSGVTFATLQSQQIKLTGNSIQTATANLQISSDGNTYGSSQEGYAFVNLVPGGGPVPASASYKFYLKNAGAVPLALKFAVTNMPSNPSNVDLSKVTVILTPVGGGTPQTIPLATLIDSANSGGVQVSNLSALAANTVTQYAIQISMAADAVSGSSAALNNIDFAFTGVAQSN